PADPELRAAVAAWESYLERARGRWPRKLQLRRPAPCPVFRVTRMGRYFANHGKLRLLRWRSRYTSADYSVGMNGRPRLLMKSSARKPPAMLTLAKLITDIGWRRSNA